MAQPYCKPAATATEPNYLEQLMQQATSVFSNTLSSPAPTLQPYTVCPVSCDGTYTPMSSTVNGTLRSTARGGRTYSREPAAARVACYPHHRRGHPALPRCLLAGHAHVLWPALASESVRPWLHHQGAPRRPTACFTLSVQAPGISTM